MEIFRARLSTAAVLAALIAALTACSVAFIPASDLWWHLASGRLILAFGRVPDFDPFAFTTAGQHWLNHEWLFGVIAYTLETAWGLTGLYIVKSAVIVAVFLIGFALARRRGAPLWAAAVITCIAAWVPRLVMAYEVRPQLATYLGMAVTWWLLETAAPGRGRRLWLLAPLFWLWSNLHGGFVLGYMLVGIWMAGSAMQQWLARRRQSALIPSAPNGWGSPAKLAIIVGTAAALCLLNPYGWRIFLFPFQFLQHSVFTATLNEWRPPQERLEWYRPDLVLLAGAALVMFLGKTHTRPVDWLVLGAMGILAQTAARHLPLLCWAVLPATAGAVGGLCAAMNRVLVGQWPSWPDRARRWVLPAALGLLGGTLCWAIPVVTARPPADQALVRTHFPRDAAAFLAIHRLPSRVFNPYGWGGYLAWVAYPEYQVFMDGRANTVYSDRSYADALRISRTQPGWEALLDAYRVDMVLTNSIERDADIGVHIDDALSRSPRWSRIYADPLTRIYLRRAPQYAAVLEQARRKTLALPHSPYWQFFRGNVHFTAGHWGAARALYASALALDPGYGPALVGLGAVANAEGLPDDAFRYFHAAVRLDPGVEGAHYYLGRHNEARGRLRAAAADYAAELRLRPDFAPALDALKFIRLP